MNALIKTLRSVPENADYVMYWWGKAADLARKGRMKSFGFITTNSITQTFNRAVLHNHLSQKKPLSVRFAIPDHPWVDSSDGAAVRVAMTVGQGGKWLGHLFATEEEIKRSEFDYDVVLGSPQIGAISEDLRVGASPAQAEQLKANAGVAFWGVKFYGDGFIVTCEEADAIAFSQDGRTLARPFVSGRDLTQKRRNLWTLDCDGLTEDRLRTKFSASYQRLLDRVKPVREQNPRSFKRERWWIFGENQPGMRKATSGIRRYIVTTETAKHRFFRFLNGATLAEGTISVIALEDAYFLGVLSSRVHVSWALAAGGTLEDRPRYNKTRCFDPFPFPDASEEQKACIRELGEQLDAHRKARQEEHPELTMTAMYNVLEKLRTGKPLSDKEKAVHETGLISVLKQFHDDLDAAVFTGYGWPAESTDEAILERLIALNKERATEEARGHVGWLRPEFQNPEGTTQPTQTEAAFGAAEPAAAKAAKAPWPKSLPEQAEAVRSALAGQGGPVTVAELAKAFRRANRARLTEILETLASLGQARLVGADRYTL